MSKRGLTDKQKQFVDEYLIDLNATQAAIRAGYSKKTAGWIGPQLLTKTHITEKIAERKKDRLKRTEITQDDVIRELQKIAFGNKRNIMKWGPDGVKLIDSEELTDDDAAMVSEVSETITQHGGSIKLKTHDKVKALELLGKHFGIFIEKHEHTGKNGNPLPVSTVTVYLPDNGR